MDIKQPKKRITLGEIAQLAGVSKTTASMILNGKGENFRIRPETRQRVEAIAKQHGYRANAYARSLQAQRTNVIGMVIPDLANYGFASTAKTLEKLCRDKGLLLVIACSDDNPQQEKQAIERLLDRQVDLLITAPTHQDPSYYNQIIKHTPVLQLDRHIPNLELSYVISQDRPAIAELVAQTVAQEGLSEYYYLGGKLALSPSENRLQGFKQGLVQAGLDLNEDWIWHRDYQPDSGYQMLADIVAKLGRLPQAIFTASYTLLEGVLRYLTEHQLMDKLLSGQLHLTTFDDHKLLNALPFKIHSIGQNHQAIAQAMFGLVERYLKQEKLESHQVACEIFWR
ncbi:transcriptional regulator [Pasteurellaceae bacterium RH1A]|nr:transcriptional regulator [Pasteurellaceae bacterium RH1A]